MQFFWKMYSVVFHIQYSYGHCVCDGYWLKCLAQMRPSHILCSLGSYYYCMSSFFVALFAIHLARDAKLSYSCLCPPSVSVSAQPALHTPPKRSMLSPSPLTTLKRRLSMISLRTRGILRMINLNWQRRNLWQVGRLHINSCRARNQSSDLPQ